MISFVSALTLFSANTNSEEDRTFSDGDLSMRQNQDTNNNGGYVCIMMNNKVLISNYCKDTK